MGRRNTSSTKSGKYMNPTDQARKEARKRELKKNKKQRVIVRAAALKGKNPNDVIAELEKIDDMEFNVLMPPPLNGKVLLEKRRKLHETWHRVLKMFEKENPEQYVELKKLWLSYQNRKREVVSQFQAVKNAQNVTVDSIPLPSGDLSGTDAIPLPPAAAAPKAILKKPQSVLDALKPKTCPGIPSTVPPDLADYDEPDEGEGVGGGEGNAADVPAVRKRTIRFDDGDDVDVREKVDPADLPPGTAELDEDGPHVDDVQRRMLRMAGQDVDQYMKEMEEVHRKTQMEKQQDIQNRIAKLDGQQPQEELLTPLQQQPPQQLIPPPPPHHPHPAHLHPHMVVPPRGGVPLMYRPAPPPLRPGVAPPGVRLPPGPPPGAPPAAAGYLPGPPPGRPPMMQTRFPLRPQSVLSAGPQINREATAQAVAAAAAATTASGPAGAPAEKTPSANASGVIEAKPQMRNLRTDVTRFVPTNVKLAKKQQRQIDPMTDVFRPPQQPQQRGGPLLQQPAQPQQQQQSKDDAYAQFMSEMDQLLK